MKKYLPFLLKSLNVLALVLFIGHDYFPFQFEFLDKIPFLGYEKFADKNGFKINEAPVQTNITPVVLNSGELYKDFKITAFATYSIKGRVLSTNRHFFYEKSAALSKYDFALGWHEMSDTANLNTFKINQMGRTYNLFSKGKDAHEAERILQFSSNNHLIAANEKILRELSEIKKDDFVFLQGYLVDVSSNRSHLIVKWNSSRIRTDVGNYACEVFYVTGVQKINPN